MPEIKDIDVLENSRNKVMKEITEENEQPSFQLDIKAEDTFEKFQTFGPRVFSINDELQGDNQLNEKAPRQSPSKSELKNYLSKQTI